MTDRLPGQQRWSEIPSLPSPADVEGFLREVRDADAGPPPSGPPPPRPAPLSGPELTERLRARFPRQGAIVMIALPNTVQLLSCFFSVLRAGCVPLLAAPSTPLARIRLNAVRLGAAGLIRARVPAAPPADGRVSRLGGLDLLEFAGHPLAHCEPGQVIMLTSGTSGRVTGCVHDFAALLRNATRHADSIGLRQGDRILINLPIHYSFALVAQVLAGLATGARLVLAGPPFAAARYSQTLAAHQVTVSSLTPLLVSAVLKSGTGLPSELRVLTVGGAALPPEHTAKLLGDNPAKEVYLTYGLTEAGPRVTTLPAHEQAPKRYASVGRPLRGVALRTRDAGRGDRDQEILVRSDTLCLHRLGSAAKTGLGALTEHGALATGDVGYLDEDGYLFLRGRLSDFVIIRGEKVNLALVKQIAESIEGIVRAVPVPGGSGDGAEPLELDLYTDDEKLLGDPGMAWRRLSALLTPSERPGTIRIHEAASELPHK